MKRWARVAGAVAGAVVAGAVVAGVLRVGFTLPWPRVLLAGLLVAALLAALRLFRLGGDLVGPGPWPDPPQPTPVARWTRLAVLTRALGAQERARRVSAPPGTSPGGPVRPGGET